MKNILQGVRDLWSAARTCVWYGIIMLMILVVFSVALISDNAVSAPDENVTRILHAETRDVGSVVVNVTPALSRDVSKFVITLTTHAGSLDVDLATSATLTMNDGRTFRPREWAGDPPGGHHRSGTLTFDGVLPTATTMTLQISSIAGEVVTMSWDLASL